MDIDRRAFIASLGGASAVALMTSEQKADALEAYMEETLDAAVQQGGQEQAPKYPTMAEIEEQNAKRMGVRRGGGNIFNATGRDGKPRGLLPKMSDRPTLLEFFEKRFAPANHVLQSATRALKTGMPEEIILACLMHDTVHALVKVDHGWWGAQIIEPYVSEKVVVCDPPPSDAALLSGREVRLRVPGELPADVRRGLQAGCRISSRTTSGCATTSGTTCRAW